MSVQQVWIAVPTGHRMAAHLDCSPACYALMKICWEADAHARPSFEEVARALRVAIDDQWQVSVNDEASIFDSEAHPYLDFTNGCPEAPQLFTPRELAQQRRSTTVESLDQRDGQALTERTVLSTQSRRAQSEVTVASQSESQTAFEEEPSLPSVEWEALVEVDRVRPSGSRATMDFGRETFV